MKTEKSNMRTGTACYLPCIAALTLILALAQALPVYASQDVQNGQAVQGGPSAKGGRNTQSIQETGAGEITFNSGEPSTSADSRVTGHIHVELISVVMPTGGLEFQVDTKAPFQMENPGVQIQSPEIQTKNLSVMPVKLEMSQMAEIKDEDAIFSERFSSQAEQSFQLVDRISSVGASRIAILVLGGENREYSKTSSEKDATIPGKRNIFTTDIPAGETRTLKLYGEAALDFYGEYQFTVRPTLKISAIQADLSD